MTLARQFAFYLLRWQMSTPILWLVVSQLGAGLGATIAANLIGGAIFFWIDRIIFSGRMDIEWELLATAPAPTAGTRVSSAASSSHPAAHASFTTDAPTPTPSIAARFAAAPSCSAFVARGASRAGSSRLKAAG